MHNLLMALVILLSATTVAVADDRKIEDRRMFADGLYARGMYALAVEEYRALLEDVKELPEQDVVWFRLGECLRLQGENIAAEQAYRHVFAGFPDSPLRHRAGFQRAVLFANMERHAEAAALFGEVLDAKPPDDVLVPAAFYRGEALFRINRRDEAYAAFDKAVRGGESPFLAAALLRKGELLAVDPRIAAAPENEQERRRTALSFYRRALGATENERERAEALFHIGRLSYLLDDFKDSAESYRQLMESYPQDARSAEARLQAAWAAYRAGLYREAAGVAEASVNEKSPQQDEWLYLLANSQRQLLDREKALELYDRMLKDFRRSERIHAARYERAVVLYSLGRYKAALKAAEDIKQGVRPVDVHWLAAEAAAADENLDKAVLHYRKLISAAPADPQACDARYRLGFILQKLQQWGDAAEAYRSLVDACPQHSDVAAALFSAGVCYWTVNDHSEALRNWTEFVERFPEHSLQENARYRKALCEIRLEKTQNALATIKDLLKRFPDGAHAHDAYYWQGVLLKQTGKPQDAVKSFTQAMKHTDAETAAVAAIQRGSIEHSLEKFPDAAATLVPVLATPFGVRIDPALLAWLAAYELEQGRNKSALAAAEALAGAARDANWRQAGWTLAGRVQRAAGDDKAAAAAYRKALEERAVTVYAPEAALRLAGLLAADDKLEEARQWARRAAEWSSDEAMLGIRANAYLLLGELAERLGENDTAISMYLSVGLLFDDPEIVPPAMKRAAELLEKAGRHEEAARVRAELE